MLNFAYDVNLKQFSSNLLLLTFFLLAPDLRRRADVLVLHRTSVAPRVDRPVLSRLRSLMRPELKTLFIAGSLYTIIFVNEESRWEWNWEAHWGRRVPLSGAAYVVERFSRSGELVLPLATDSSRWKRLLVAPSGLATVTFMDDRQRTYLMSIETLARRLSLAPVRQPSRNYFITDSVRAAVARVAATDSIVRAGMAFAFPDPQHLAISGRIGGDSLDMRFRVIRDRDLPLTGSRWHFISARVNNSYRALW